MPANQPNELSEIFDLDRRQLITRLTANIETCLRDIQTAQDDLKEIIASAREAQVSAREIAAMKQVAKLRMKDQVDEARGKLAALQRVGDAVGVDLFNWMDAEAEPQPEA